MAVATRYTGGMLLLAVLTAGGGCRHYVQPPLLNSTWFDYSLYQRPAVYFDHKSHYPSQRQHIQHYLWQHPASQSAVVEADWLPPQLDGQVLISPHPDAVTPQAETKYEQAPDPQFTPQNPIQIELPGELQPPYSPPLLTPPPAPVPLPVPLRESETKTLLEPLPTVGPTAQTPQRDFQPYRQVGWQNGGPQLPGLQLLFPR